MRSAVALRLSRLVLACAWLVVAACGFNERKFADRHCNADQDCLRPDESCLLDTCTQRACQTSADCGPGFAYACTAGACVAQTCSGPTDCLLGFACVADFCQASFNVASASSTSNGAISVTFDAPPDPTAATKLTSYAISGLTLMGTPTLSGSTVTLLTSAQDATSYTVTVSGVTRASDAATLTIASATFTGRTTFNVASAASTGSVSMVVTFDAPPDPTTATTLANYAAPGLTLGGTPSLSGNTVTLGTSPQSTLGYTVTVSGVRRASDGEPLAVMTASFGGRPTFNVASAASTSSTSMTVTFDTPPDAALATTLANYAVPGLTLSGAPLLVGSTVTLATSAQAAGTYTVTVTGVTRASDAEPLTVRTANFMGTTPFDVASAAAVNSGAITVTFDAAPDPTTATVLDNYDIPGLTLGGTPTLVGNTVTLVTSPQTAASYTVTVSGVARASDAEPLTVDTATFTGRAPFDVASAASTSSNSITVTFDAPPNAAQAATLANYTVAGLTLNGTPSLAGNTVTIATSPQSATTFTVDVSGVTRASDAEALTAATASFLGRAPFDVASAVSTSSGAITVTFDAPPDAAQATTLAHFSVPGLTLSGAPSLAGNTVTIATSPQSATTYGVVVSGVARASDAEPLTVATASFTGRPPFNVVSATSTSNVAMTLTFDGAPNGAQATTLANYSVVGLTLSGTPTLSGNTVTITTSPQTLVTYPVTVSGVTRASDAEVLTITGTTFTGRTGFNVASAASANTTTMTVTYDAPPNAAQATTLANYSVPGLTLTGTASLAGSTVTITTSAQAAGTFTVTVANVTRASDGSPLAVNSASFTHTDFNVANAASVTSHSISVTFDAPPDMAQATTLANYSVLGLTLSGTPTLAGNTVTITTSTQAASTFTAKVINVTRASDGTVLSVNSAMFTGRTPFNVASAASTSSGSITVTFDAAPTAAQATTLASYSITGGLTVYGTPVLSGNVVTLNTSAQAAVSYTVTVTGVTRAADGEPLSTSTASFTGKALKAPTVTNVVVQTTAPSNGTTFYNTGTATVVITGTEFAGVVCPTGVALDDLDGIGTAVGTHPTSCTVDSGTQITATFPSGIRTNGTLGWNVKVTNAVGTNTSSTLKLIPKAGLLISEVFTGVSGSGQNRREFFELYNPTANALDVSATGLGMAIHIRTGSGVDGNVVLTFLSPVAHRTIKSHGFLLIASSQTSNFDAWASHRDATYDAAATELVGNGGLYVSLSTTANAKVIDKDGWGSQPVGGFETKATPNISADNSTQRKPAGGAGAATDVDNNSTDFLAQSTTTTPQGTADPTVP